MTSLDDALLPAVTSILTELGKDLTYVLREGQAAGEYDLVSGDVVDHTDASEISAKSLPPGNYSHYFTDKATLKDGDLQTGVAGENLVFDPEGVGMLQVIIDGRTWTVMNKQPVYSGEQICLWLFNCRGGT